MSFFGAYHVDVRPHAPLGCDAPCISKGQMMLSGFETASDADGVALAYGRMNNRTALAKQLECAPYASPAMVVLQAYRRWGEDYVNHIEGPCMTCVADVNADRMILAADRMGECGIFFSRSADRMIFAYHPDMLLKTCFVKPVLRREGLCQLFGLGPARTPGKTPLDGIEPLEAGCMLVCEKGEIRKKRWFKLETCPCEDKQERIVSHVRELLEQAVDCVVPLHPAGMLSGGLDSTALTALLCTRIGRMETFSVDYAGNEADFIANAFRPEMDAPYVRLAARVFGTRHRTIILQQDALADGLDKAMRFRGFPGMADIDSSLMLFAKDILRFSGSVVSGECGDEVFGGYPWFRGEVQLPDDAFPWSGSMDLRENILLPRIREKLKLKSYVQDELHNALDSYDVSTVSDSREKTLFKLQRLCFDYFMPNLQERAVKMCESQGLAVLTPLCDDRLVQYVYNVPWSIKFLGGAEKGLFREAVRDLLPDKLRMRKKSPYPKTCSSAYADAIRRKMRDLFADPRAPIWQLVDADCIEKYASSPLNPGDTPWYGQLMAGPQMLAYLLQVNSWMQERQLNVELD